ncbi:MAG: lipopolysaccharide heptosyltransferase II [Pirellulales bacterium]|nr:lipopolysaccharide heptosyltransferase II [Pirellulales bacterium]
MRVLAGGPRTNMHLGVFLPNWIGDVVMATPALRALRHHFPQARITGLLRPYVADVLAGTSWLDATIPYDPRGKDAAQRTLSLLRRMRRERFDAIVLLTGSFRTALLAWASGAARRVGYARHGRALLLTDRLEVPRVGGRIVPAPVLDAYLQLAYRLGCPSESPRMELATLPADEAAADAVWQRLGLAPASHVVCFNIGGAYGAAKLWPSEYFAALAQRLAAQRHCQVLVLCGPHEREAARRIVSMAGHPHVTSLADGPTTLGLIKACVRRSELLISTDSGPRHFAPAFDVPVITLFGPTHIAWSETHYARAVHLQVDVPCGPCQRRVCPLGHHRCMRDLSVDQVFAAASAMLGRAAHEQAA